MENFKHIYALVFIFLLVLVVRILFRKNEIHFKLLKELFPKSFNGINSVYAPNFFLYLFKLDVNTVFWFIIPIYFRRRLLLNTESEKLKLLDKELVVNNIKLCLYAFIMIVWVFAIRYFLP
jgi:hypothetical protein